MTREEDDPLTFAPADVAFVVVDTSERAVWWNKALHGHDEQTRDVLSPYGQQGVYAIPLESIAGSPAQ